MTPSDAGAPPQDAGYEVVRQEIADRMPHEDNCQTRRGLDKAGEPYECDCVVHQMLVLLTTLENVAFRASTGAPAPDLAGLRRLAQKARDAIELVTASECRGDSAGRVEEFTIESEAADRSLDAALVALCQPSDAPKVDWERVCTWMRDANRKPANTAFTAGPERQLAYAFEDALSEAK